MSLPSHTSGFSSSLQRLTGLAALRQLAWLPFPWVFFGPLLVFSVVFLQLSFKRWPMEAPCCAESSGEEAHMHPSVDVYSHETMISVFPSKSERPLEPWDGLLKKQETLLG